MNKKINCKFCNSDNFSDREFFVGSTEAYKNDNFEYGRCDSCASIINLTTDEPQYDDYVTGKNISKRKVDRFVGFLKSLKIKKGAKVLDYGCGEGALFLELKKRGFNAEGYEPFGKIYSKLDKKKRYDVIYMTHVFEHLTDYKNFFSDIKKISKEGTLVITIHPSASRIKKLDSRCPFQNYTVHAPFHTALPSDNAAISLFKSKGYQIKRKIRYDIQRSGIRDNNRVSALLSRSVGGTKEKWLGAEKKIKILALARSPLKFLDSMLINTKDYYVSTLIFERL